MQLSGAANYGGGIVNGGRLSVSSSTFVGNNAPGNAGAIFNFGNLTIANSSLFGNSSGARGGAIDSEGSVSVTNTTFANNSATAGGGLYNESRCGFRGTARQTACGPLSICTNLLKDPDNCGACGHMCAAGQRCSTGTCR